jgi:hypothetical protein
MPGGPEKTLGVVPLAMARLDQDPLAEGDMYPGALLAAMLRVNPGFWADHRDHAGRLTAILAALADPPASLKRGIDNFTRAMRGRHWSERGAGSVGDTERTSAARGA